MCIEHFMYAPTCLQQEEARQRQALIQQAIDKAAEAAERERQRARSHKHGHNLRNHPRGSKYDPMQSEGSTARTVAQGVSFDLRHARRGVYGSGEGASADVRSPSMLKLNSKGDVHSPRHTQQQQQQHQKGQGSRIPVRSKGSGRTRAVEALASTPSGVRRRAKQAHTSTPSGKSGAMQAHASTSSGKSRPSEEMAWTTPIRAASPPVPTLAKRLQHEGTTQHHKAIPAATGLGPRVQSPPVPALAKKLKYGATADESRAHMPQQSARATPPPLRLPPVQSGTGTHRVVARSSPVPALRKGSQQEATQLPPLVTVRDEAPPQDILKQLLDLRKVR